MISRTECRFPKKRAHATYEAAVAHRAWLRKARGANDDVVVYACGDHWHVGHDPALLIERARRSIRPTPPRRRQHR